MKDRISTKILPSGATRYGVYDEEGSLLRYEYIKLEDEPSTEGDLFCKANMLPDTIPQLLGLAKTNPQVKDVLGVLPEIGNLHIWKKTRVLTEAVPAVPAGYTLGEVETDVLVGQVNSSYVNASNGKMIVGYYPSVDVSDDGEVSLPSVSRNVESFLSAVPNNLSSIGSNFVVHKNSTYGNIIFFTTDIVYVPSDGVYSVTSDDTYYYLWLSKLQRVTGYAYTPEIPAGTHVDYLASTDENAYRESSNGSEAYYTLGDVVNEVHGLGGYRRSINQSMYISSNVSVSEDGTVTMESPTSTSIGANGTYDSYSQASTLQTAIVGKFVKLVSNSLGWYGSTPQLPLDVVLYIPSDASVSIIEIVTDVDMGSVSDAYAVSSYQPVTGHAAVPADTTIEYLGQLGEGARIETGSYVGTGTYGSTSNMVKVEPSFIPKLFFVQEIVTTNKYQSVGIFVMDPNSDAFHTSVGFFQSSGSSVATYWMFVALNTSVPRVGWYADSPTYQFNKSGSAYKWTAIG